MLSVRFSEPRDVQTLAPHLRTADLQEIAAASGESPVQTLQRGLELSVPCYTVCSLTGRVLAMFGVVPDRRRAGVVWLLGSDMLPGYSIGFLRKSRKWIDVLHQGYDLLWNYVDARNQVHIRWLLWTGFLCTGSVEGHGPEKRLFYRFERGVADDHKRRTAGGF